MADRQVTALCAMSRGSRGSGHSARNERRATPRSSGIAGRGECCDLGSSEEPWGVGGPCWNRRASGSEASREGRSGQRRERQGSEGKLSQRQRSRDNPAGRPTGGMTATRPPPSRDNPAAEGRHVTIPPPGGTTRVLAKAQGTAKLAKRQERWSGGLRAPATGGATQQARLSGGLRAPAAGGALQHGLQGPGEPPSGERRGTPWAPRIKTKSRLHLHTTLE